MALRVTLRMGRKRPCIRDKLEDRRGCYSLPVGVRIHILPSLNPLLPPPHSHRPLSQSSVSLPVTSTVPQGKQPVPRDSHLCSSRAPCCSQKPGWSPVGALGAGLHPACTALHHSHAQERFPSHVGTPCIPPPTLGLEPDPGSPAPPSPQIPRCPEAGGSPAITRLT